MCHDLGTYTFCLGYFMNALTKRENINKYFWFFLCLNFKTAICRIKKKLVFIGVVFCGVGVGYH